MQPYWIQCPQTDRINLRASAPKNDALLKDPFAAFCVTNLSVTSGEMQRSVNSPVATDELKNAALGSQFAIVQGRKLRP